MGRPVKEGLKQHNLNLNDDLFKEMKKKGNVSEMVNEYFAMLIYGNKNAEEIATLQSELKLSKLKGEKKIIEDKEKDKADKEKDQEENQKIKNKLKLSGYQCKKFPLS